MKKAICVIGIISAMVGFIMLVSASMEIAGNSRYTWEKPYTKYEKKVLSEKYAGIVLMISGGADIVLTVISTAYTARTIQDTKNNPAEFLICTACHCKTMKGTTVCPNCGRRFN